MKTLVDPEGIMLNEINQMVKDKNCMISLIYGIQTDKTKLRCQRRGELEVKWVKGIQRCRFTVL